MLVDDRLFDTNVYSLETNRMLDQYQRLVRKPKNMRTPTEIKKLRTLASELRSKQLPEVRESHIAEELRKFQKKHDL